MSEYDSYIVILRLPKGSVRDGLGEVMLREIIQLVLHDAEAPVDEAILIDVKRIKT